jgi:poly(A) polymerase
MKKHSFINEERRILNRIRKFSQIKNIKLYIVGGFLRDIILGRQRENPDIDFAIKKNAIKFAAGLAKQTKAGLDKDNGCARLVKKGQNRAYTLDFADFRGNNLYQDLRNRDFTINSLAIELEVFLAALNGRGKHKFSFPASLLADPYHGLADLRSRTIRAINPSVFDDDPLRILRTFSLSCILDFKIEPRTLRLIKKKRNKLKKASFERIREELFKILASENCYKYLIQLDQYRLLELILPEIKAMHSLNQGPYHHLDVWGHTLETIRHLEKIIKNFSRNQDIRNFLNEEISSGRKRQELVKLGGLMHDIGKPKTLRIEEGKVKFHGHERQGASMLREAAVRLRLSKDEVTVLKRIVLFHLRPGYLADNPILTKRARFRFFRDSDCEAISVLLISLADQRATKGPLATRQSRLRHERVVRRLIKDYFQKKKEKKAKRLINGNDLIRHFKLEPSPLIGRILSEVEEAQAIGKIKTKTEALKIANSVLRTK